MMQLWVNKPGLGRHIGDILFSNLVGRLKRIKAKSWVCESGLNSGCKTMDSMLTFTDEMSNVHLSYSPKDIFISGAVALLEKILIIYESFHNSSSTFSKSLFG